MPPKHTPYISAYLSSKVAQVKVMEFLAAENPELFICSVHPGMVDTDILRGSGADPKQLPIDTGKYPLSLQDHVCAAKHSCCSGAVRRFPGLAIAAQDCLLGR
jgi:NAD(P)-dependent dehydrogenase (short-subunit alcohol dehydrogenase family)